MKRTFKLLVLLTVISALCIGVNAAFTKTQTYTEGKFSDIPDGAWYASEVKNTYELGFMEGTDDNTFAPEDNVTLAQAITVAARVSAIYNGEQIPAAEGQWYQQYVNYAVQKGFYEVKENENYNRPASRLEVAQFFAKALPADYYGAKNDVAFIPDMLDGSKGYDELMMLYRAGVVLGNDEIGSFYPKNNIRRMEISAIVNRVALPENRLDGDLGGKDSTDEAYFLAYHTDFNGNIESKGEMVQGIASGWMLDNRGGERRTEYKYGYERLSDVSETEGVALIREYNKTETGNIVLETEVACDRKDGLYLEYRNDKDESIYRIEIKDNKWQHRNADGSYTEIYAPEEAEGYFLFRIEVDLDNKFSKTYINDEFCGAFRLASENANVCNFRFAFTEEGTGTAYPGVYSSYVNYGIYDDFVMCDNNDVPIYWNTENAAIDKNAQLLINDGGRAVRSFSDVDGKAIFEYNFFQVNGEALEVKVSQGNKNVLVFTNDENHLYVNGKKFYENYVKNLWYRIRAEIDFETGKTVIKLNSRKVFELDLDTDADAINRAEFAAKGKNGVTIDYIRAFSLVEVDDYVPVPVPLENDDDYIVGLNICSLWRNHDHHKSWGHITGYDDKRPVLGYYDEGNPETADWEIKFMVEHGIDFQMFCWYPNTTTAPIVPKVVFHLQDAYMNAKYSDMMNYCIIWEASGSAPTVENFKKFFVPYWIENYFKDKGRYMTIDGKPVLVVYSIETLRTGMGGNEKVKEAFDYLRAEVKKLGYEDMLIFASGSSYKDLAALGIDGVFPYNWSSPGYDPEINKENMLMRQQGADVYSIPTVSVGFNNIGWVEERKPIMTAEGFKETVDWIRDEYIPKYADKDSWQKNLLMLSTWNEYGEGTYIMPCEDNCGFGYLDALKESLHGASSDTCNDVIPTESQAKRINRLYPQHRRLLTHEDLYEEEYTGGNSKVLYTIDFTKNEYFSKPSYITDYVFDENGFSGVGTGDAQISYAFAGELPETSEIATIRVTGTFPKGDRVNLFYMTTDDSQFTSRKSFAFMSNNIEEQNVYYIDTSTASEMLWDGKISKLRIDPTTIAGKSFNVQKIEFLSYDDSRDIEFDGKSVQMQYKPVTEADGTVTIGFEPRKAMDFMLDCFAVWDDAEQRLTLNFEENVIVFTVGSDKYVLNGQEKSLGFKIRSVDGLPYIPLKLVCDVQGYEYTTFDSGKIKINTGYNPDTDSTPIVERQQLLDFTGSTSYEKSGHKVISRHTDTTNPEHPYEYMRAMPKDDANIFLYAVHPIKFVPGTTYRVVADLRVVSHGLTIPAPMNVLGKLSFNMQYNDFTSNNHVLNTVDLSYSKQWQHVAFEFTVPETSLSRNNDMFSIYANPYGGRAVGYEFRNVYISDARDPSNEAFEAELEAKREADGTFTEWSLTGFTASSVTGKSQYGSDEGGASTGENVYYMAVPNDGETRILYSNHTFKFTSDTNYKVTGKIKALPHKDGTETKTTIQFNMMYFDPASNNHVVHEQTFNSKDGWCDVEFFFKIPASSISRSDDKFTLFSNPNEGLAIGYAIKDMKVEIVEDDIPEDKTETAEKPAPAPQTPAADTAAKVGTKYSLDGFSASTAVGTNKTETENGKAVYTAIPNAGMSNIFYSTHKFTFIPGATYKFKCDLRINENDGNSVKTSVAFNMMYDDAESKNHVIYTEKALSSDDGWKTVEFEFTVSDKSSTRSADSVTLFSQAANSKSVGYSIKGAELEIISLPKTEQNTQNNTDKTESSASSDTRNIPENIGGELYNFSVSAAGGTGRRAVDPDDDDNYCYLAFPGRDDAVYLYSFHPYTFEPGATYEVSVDLKIASMGKDLNITDESFGTKLALNMQYKDDSGSVNHVVLSKKVTVEDGWVNFTKEFTVSEASTDRSADKFSIYAEPSSGVTVGYYIDNLIITKK